MPKTTGFGFSSADFNEGREALEGFPSFCSRLRLCASGAFSRSTDGIAAKSRRRRKTGPKRAKPGATTDGLDERGCAPTR